MQEQLKCVEDFHRKFNVPYKGQPTVQLGLEQSLLRYKLMREENEEYLDAAHKGDLEEIADALGDMLYILCGTIITHGMQHKIVEVFAEIHRSNLSKLGEDGKPIYREDGKVMKGPNFSRPDIASVLGKGDNQESEG